MQIAATNNTFTSISPKMTPESSKSSTLAQRRRIPESKEKLKLNAEHTQSSSPDQHHHVLFDRIALLSPTKVSEDILLSHLERQQKTLSQFDSTYQTISFDATPVISVPSHTANTHNQENEENQPMAFWKQIVQDYVTTAQHYPSLLLTLLSGGIPHCLRGAVWQAMAQSNASHLLATYDELSQQLLSSSSNSSHFHSMIDHDVNTLYGRKYSQHVLDAMKKILKVFTLYDPLLDYSTTCLSLLVPLLHYVSESQAFCLYVRLMDVYDMRSMFIPKNCQVIPVKARLFELLFGQFCPQLESHLDQHMIRSMHYAGQWYPSLLSTVLPNDAVIRIYDLVFALGSMETVTRAGLALMQKSESSLLAITDDPKSLLLSVCTPKLFDLGYRGDVDAFIMDTMACGNTISNEKLITMMDTLTSQTALHDELAKKMEHATTLDDKKKEKRESWFSSWSTASSNKQQPSSQTQPLPATPTSPSSASFHRQQNDRTVPMLHQQIEDLVTALSQLQKDHSQLSEEMMATKLRDMERQVEQSKLQKRNSTLEKKVKKYKIKLTQQQQAIQERGSVLDKQDEQYQSFVRSLRLSGNFGALVAGALDNDSPITKSNHEQRKRQSICSQTQTDNYMPLTQEQQQKQKDELVKEVENKANDSNDQKALNAVTSELVTVKLANFEMGQKYEQLCHKYSDMEQDLTKAKQQVTLQAIQVEQLSQQLAQSTREKDDFLEEQAAIWSEEQEALLQENEDWMDKVMAAKKTASELHMDKLELMKQVECQEQRIQQLETEKRDYLMPRASFTEDVFAAHDIFFGQQNQQQSKDDKATAAAHQQALDEFRLKYVEADLRCRELEKLLAETKVKVAEYESNSGLSSMASSICCSPRASLQQRASSLQMKRASTASFLTASSITAGGPSTRVATPTSPTTAQSPSFSSYNSPGPNRMSNESCASSTTSSTPSLGSNSKRASMYARICSSFSAAPTTNNTNAIKSPVLYEEPQSTI